MSFLSSLDLELNTFSGKAFFDGIFFLTDTLTDYKLSDNAFTGSIPTGINEFSLLKSLWLANNSITGSIPNGITDLDELGELNGTFSFIIFDNI